MVFEIHCMTNTWIRYGKGKGATVQGLFKYLPHTIQVPAAYLPWKYCFVYCSDTIAKYKCSMCTIEDMYAQVLWKNTICICTVYS